MRKSILALFVIAGVAMLSGTVAASSPADRGDITCEDFGGVEDGVARIAYEDTQDDDLWGNAAQWADEVLDKCNLEGREQTELAGEIRAHVIGDAAPFGHPGATIDMTIGHEAAGCQGSDGSSSDNCGDPQEDTYGYLMWV